MADSVVLEEEIDPDYEPTESEVIEYANWLGMDLENDKDILWIAREGLKAPLPENWKPCKTTDTNEVYYFNFSTGESKWEHPCDEFYRNLYEEEKKRKIQRNGLGKGGKKAKEERRRKKKEKKEILEIVGKQRNRAPDKEDVDQLRSLVAEAPRLETASLNRKGSSSLSLKPLPSLSNSILGKKPLPDLRPTTAPVLKSNQSKPASSEALRPKSSRSARRDNVLEEESKASESPSFKAVLRNGKHNVEGSFNDTLTNTNAEEGPEDDLLRETERHHAKLAELRRKHKLDRESLELDFKEELYQTKTINEDKIKREYERTRQRCLEELEDKERALNREHKEQLEFLEAEMEEEYQRRTEELKKKGEEDLDDMKKRLEEKQLAQLGRLEQTYDSTVAEAKKFLSRAAEERTALFQERESLKEDSSRQRGFVTEQREKLNEREQELDERMDRLQRKQDQLDTERLHILTKEKDLERREREISERLLKREDDGGVKTVEIERQYHEEIAHLKAERDESGSNLEAVQQEASTYKKRLLDREAEIAKLGEEISTLQNRLIESLDEKPSSSESEFLKNRLKELGSEMKEAAEMHDKRIEELLHDARTKDSKISQREERIRELGVLLEKERASLRSRVSAEQAADQKTLHLREMLRKAEAQMNTYKSALHQAEKQAKEASEKASEAQRFSEKLESSLKSEQNDHANTLAKLSVLEHDNSTLKQQLAYYKDSSTQGEDASFHEQTTQVSMLQEELDSSEREIEFLHKAVDDLKDTLARKDVELDSGLHPKEARELVEEARKAKTEEAYHGAKLADLESQNQLLQSDIRELETSKEMLSERLEASVKTETGLRERILALERKEQANLAHSLRNSNTCQLCTDSDKIRNELGLTKRQLLDSDLLIADLKASLEVLEERVTASEEAEASLRSCLQEAEFNLQEERRRSSSLCSRIEEMSAGKQAQGLREVTNSVDVSAEGPREEISALEARLKKAHAATFKVEQRLKEVEVEKFELELRLSKVQKERKLLLSDLEQSCKKNAQLTSKIELLQQQSAEKAETLVNEKLDALGTYEKRVLQEKAEVATLERKEIKLRATNEELQNRLKNLEGSHAESTERIAELTSRQKSSKAIINELEIERDSLKRGLAIAVLRAEEATDYQRPEADRKDSLALQALQQQDTVPAKENVAVNGKLEIRTPGPQLDFLLTWARERSDLVDELNSAAVALENARNQKDGEEIERMCRRIRTLQVSLDEQISTLRTESSVLEETLEGTIPADNVTHRTKVDSFSHNGHVLDGMVASCPKSSFHQRAVPKAVHEPAGVWPRSKQDYQETEVNRFAQSHSDWLLKFRSNILMDVREASLSIKPVSLESNPKNHSAKRLPTFTKYNLEPRTERDPKKRRKKTQRKAKPRARHRVSNNLLR